MREKRKEKRERTPGKSSGTPGKPQGTDPARSHPTPNPRKTGNSREKNTPEALNTIQSRRKIREWPRCRPGKDLEKFLGMWRGRGEDIPGPIPRKKRSREGSGFRECSWIPFSTFPVIPAFPDAFGWDFGNSIPVPFVHPGIIKSREKKFRPDSRSDPNPPRILGFRLRGFPGNAGTRKKAGMKDLGADPRFFHLLLQFPPRFSHFSRFSRFSAFPGLVASGEFFGKSLRGSGNSGKAG